MVLSLRHGCSVNRTHYKMNGIMVRHGCSGPRVPLEHEWNYGFMVSAWMLWSAYALGTRTESLFFRGCTGQRMLLTWNTNGIMVLAWMLWSAYALGTRTELWFEHGCSGQRMLLEHKRNYGFAWMLW